MSDPSFREYAESYLAYSRRDHSASTYRTRHSLVAGKFVPFFEDRLLSDITALDIERLLVANEGTSPATRNRILSALSAMFSRAIALGHVHRNPARACPRAREHMTPLPLVSVPDQDRMLQEIPEMKRPFFLVALDSGARLGELLRLAWRDVERDTSSILLRQTKSRCPRMVRLSKRAARGLEALRPEAPTEVDLVFAEAKGADGGLRWAWRQAFKRAAAAIGQPSLRVHDLRHLAAINLIRAGVDLPTIQAHLGHKHLISTLRYAVYADRTASARAAEALDRFLGRGDEKDA